MQNKWLHHPCRGSKHHGGKVDQLPENFSQAAVLQYGVEMCAERRQTLLIVTSDMQKCRNRSTCNVQVLVRTAKSHIISDGDSGPQSYDSEYLAVLASSDAPPPICYTGV